MIFTVEVSSCLGLVEVLTIAWDFNVKIYIFSMLLLFTGVQTDERLDSAVWYVGAHYGNSPVAFDHCCSRQMICGEWDERSTRPLDTFRSNLARLAFFDDHTHIHTSKSLCTALTWRVQSAFGLLVKLRPTLHPTQADSDYEITCTLYTRVPNSNQQLKSPPCIPILAP